MVYKKYIKKDGKLYGPYVYHSRRVNGKVISEYQGMDKPTHKKFIFLFFGILFLVILLAFFFFNFNEKITGNVVQNSLINQTGDGTDMIIYPQIYFTLLSKQIPVNGTEEKDETATQIAEQNITETELSNESQTPENQSDIENSDGVEENITEEPQQSNNKTDSEEQNSAPITGGVISRILKTISNFFLSLGLTGKAVSEPILTEINGELSANEPFSYNLHEGESIELLSGSIKTDSKSLPDNVIQINYLDNIVLISTNYSESVKNNLTIPLNINQSVNLSEVKNFSINPLSEEEKKFLLEKFGNSSVQTTKSEFDKFHNRYIIRYKLGDYYIEYSYDSFLEDKILKLQMESDRIKWLRDLINQLSKDEGVNQEANQFIGDYSL